MIIRMMINGARDKFTAGQLVGPDQVQSYHDSKVR